jgi:hypothetical protein
MVSYAPGWSIEKILLLNEAVKLYGDMWTDVSKHVGKSKESCRKKYLNMKKPKAFREADWTDAEIDLLQ